MSRCPRGVSGEVTGEVSFTRLERIISIPYPQSKRDYIYRYAGRYCSSMDTSRICSKRVQQVARTAIGS